MKFSRYNRYSTIGSRIIRNCFAISHTKKQIYFLVNGDGEIRTLDPLLARQVLSQLSYTPIDIL